MKKVNGFWEAVGYLSLFGCVVGQVVVGYAYLPAQFLYLLCNIGATMRSFAIHQRPSDKVKNCTFTAITLGLIIIRFCIGG